MFCRSDTSVYLQQLLKAARSRSTSTESRKLTEASRLCVCVRSTSTQSSTQSSIVNREGGGHTGSIRDKCLFGASDGWVFAFCVNRITEAHGSSRKLIGCAFAFVPHQKSFCIHREQSQIKVKRFCTGFQKMLARIARGATSCAARIPSGAFTLQGRRSATLIAGPQTLKTMEEMFLKRPHSDALKMQTYDGGPVL